MFNIKPFLVVLALVCSAGVAVSAAAADAPAAAATSKEAINRKAVLGFYKAVSTFDFDAARPFIGETYTQHSPLIEDGLQGLKKALATYKAEFAGHALPELDVRLVLAEGDYVAMLSNITIRKGTPAEYSIAVGDLFRLEDGKLLEHWDITERLAPKPPGQRMFDQQDKAAIALAPGIM
jgi:predicted SnoaL-like aldol condensation-catalyzing enzyme